MARVTLEAKQERIVRTLEGPLFVSAGAVPARPSRHPARALCAQAGLQAARPMGRPDRPEAFLDSIDQVLAITFTDKAATSSRSASVRRFARKASMPRRRRLIMRGFRPSMACARASSGPMRSILASIPLSRSRAMQDDLKRLAVEHVLRRVTAEDVGGTGPFDELLEAFELESQDGSMSLSSLLSILVAILSKVSTLIGGLEAFEQVKAHPSHIDLYEAYRDIADTPSYANCAAARSAVEALYADRIPAAICRASCLLRRMWRALQAGARHGQRREELRRCGLVRRARHFSPNPTLPCARTTR